MQNLVISCNCFTENSCKMYKDLWCKCIKPRCCTLNLLLFQSASAQLLYYLIIANTIDNEFTFLLLVLWLAPKWLDQAILYFNEAFELCQACPPAALFSRICQGLAFCHGRSAPGLSMYYLNMSTSVTLRHQAVTRTGKRIRWKLCSLIITQMEN